MVTNRLLFAALLSIFPIQSYSQGPPEVKGSYKATGEMVEKLEDETKLLMQVAFEESYDAETQNAAFNVWVMGKNVTYIENYKTNQTFRYTDGNECELMTTEEWVKTKSPPQLLNYEDTNGTVRFSLKQLFKLDNKYLKEKNISSEFRGIPARKWMYEIKAKEPDTDSKRILTIYAYWSDVSWSTTSNEATVPLGYIVSKMVYKKNRQGLQLHEQFINVFGFVPGTINHKLFEPVQGVICEKMAQTIKFPNMANMQALALHSEVIFPDYQEIKYVDTWFDPKSKLLRIDMERIKDEIPVFEEKSRKYEVEIVLGKMGIVYNLGYFKGKASCSVTQIKDYDLDIQDLINFKVELSDWNIGKALGVNKTTYVYTGKTSKRDIPCHLFQGVRTDWPEPSLNIESLWEWCFSINVTTKDDVVIFRNGEYGLINAQVTILKSGSPSDFPPGFRVYHHFYDVNVKDPAMMDATNFDISRCFTEAEKRRLQFAVDWEITNGNIELVENATSDVAFLQKWKSIIYQFSGLDSNSLRISKVTSTVVDSQLWVKYTILAAHKDLPVDIKNKEISPFAAENQFRDNINRGRISISYVPARGMKIVKMSAVKHTLNFQVNNTFKPHVLSTTTQPSSTTNKIVFSLRTEPDEDKTSSTSDSPVTASSNSPVTASSNSPVTVSKTTPDSKGSTLSPTHESLMQKKTLHAGGTVAAVSISMLLVGITIGSAGIFVKLNGLPPCLKCGGAQTV